MGPKRRLHRRLGPGITTTPPTPAAAAVTATAAVILEPCERAQTT